MKQRKGSRGWRRALFSISAAACSLAPVPIIAADEPAPRPGDIVRLSVLVRDVNGATRPLLPVRKLRAGEQMLITGPSTRLRAKPEGRSEGFQVIVAFCSAEAADQPVWSAPIRLRQDNWSEPHVVAVPDDTHAYPVFFLTVDHLPHSIRKVKGLGKAGTGLMHAVEEAGSAAARLSQKRRQLEPLLEALGNLSRQLEQPGTAERQLLARRVGEVLKGLGFPVPEKGLESLQRAEDLARLVRELKDVLRKGPDQSPEALVRGLGAAALSILGPQVSGWIPLVREAASVAAPVVEKYNPQRWYSLQRATAVGEGDGKIRLELSAPVETRISGRSILVFTP